MLDVLIQYSWLKFKKSYSSEHTNLLEAHLSLNDCIIFQLLFYQKNDLNLIASLLSIIYKQHILLITFYSRFRTYLIF